MTMGTTATQRNREVFYGYRHLPTDGNRAALLDMEAAGAKLMNVAARRVTGLYASLPGLHDNYALLPDQRFGKSGGTLQSTAFCVMVHKDEGDKGEGVIGTPVSHLTACAYLCTLGLLSFMVYPMDEEELVGVSASPIGGYAVPLKVRLSHCVTTPSCH